MGGYILPGGLLLMLSLRFACADIHSHYFYWTVTSDQTPDSPFYTMTRTLDDITLFWYDSDDEVVERRVPWFRSPHLSLLDASYGFYLIQKDMQNFLHDISTYLNDTEGSHILQGSEGCALYGNGSVQASFRYRYDGKPFMFLNMETAVWTAETPDAEEFAQGFNANRSLLEETKHTLLNTCIPHVTQLLSMGNSTFNRKELTAIKVTQIPIANAGVRLYCRAYGHYPKDISIMWYKNGRQISEEILERVTLPFPDLTYLTSVSYNATPITDDVYTCSVSHSSMPRNFTKALRISGASVNLSGAPSNPVTGAVIAICLAVILVIVIVAFGSVACANARRQ